MLGEHAFGLRSMVLSFSSKSYVESGVRKVAVRIVTSKAILHMRFKSFLNFSFISIVRGHKLE